MNRYITLSIILKDVNPETAISAEQIAQQLAEDLLEIDQPSVISVTTEYDE